MTVYASNISDVGFYKPVIFSSKFIATRSPIEQLWIKIAQVVDVVLYAGDSGFKTISVKDAMWKTARFDLNSSNATTQKVIQVIVAVSIAIFALHYPAALMIPAGALLIKLAYKKLYIPQLQLPS